MFLPILKRAKRKLGHRPTLKERLEMLTARDEGYLEVRNVDANIGKLQKLSVILLPVPKICKLS